MSGGDLLVANTDGNSLTELDTSNGALVSVLSGPAYQFNGPDALLVSGADVFVANGANGTSIGHSVTELKL